MSGRNRKSSSAGEGGLEPVRKVFEEFGRDDPMYAALSRGGTEENRWEPEKFFETGREEIGAVIAYLEALGLEPGRDRAVDFGCAVGRLTQALGDHFAEVVGVDIAAPMIEQAREYNRHGERVTYRVNTRPDLSLLESGSVDFLYSNKVLQHIRPEHQLGYIREFMRVLRPAGLAVFQTRNGPRIRPGGPRALLYTINRVYVRRMVQRLRGKRAYEMHYLARSTIEEAVAESGGRVADVVDLSRGRPEKSLRYCALKG